MKYPVATIACRCMLATRPRVGCAPKLRYQTDQRTNLDTFGQRVVTLMCKRLAYEADPQRRQRRSRYRETCDDGVPARRRRVPAVAAITIDRARTVAADDTVVPPDQTAALQSYLTTDAVLGMYDDGTMANDHGQSTVGICSSLIARRRRRDGGVHAHRLAWPPPAAVFGVPATPATRDRRRTRPARDEFGGADLTACSDSVLPAITAGGRGRAGVEPAGHGGRRDVRSTRRRRAEPVSEPAVARWSADLFAHRARRPRRRDRDRCRWSSAIGRGVAIGSPSCQGAAAAAVRRCRPGSASPDVDSRGPLRRCSPGMPLERARRRSRSPATPRRAIRMAARSTTCRRRSTSTSISARPSSGRCRHDTAEAGSTPVHGTIIANFARGASAPARPAGRRDTRRSRRWRESVLPGLRHDEVAAPRHGVRVHDAAAPTRTPTTSVALTLTAVARRRTSPTTARLDRERDPDRAPRRRAHRGADRADRAAVGRRACRSVLHAHRREAALGQRR